MATSLLLLIIIISSELIAQTQAKFDYVEEFGNMLSTLESIAEYLIKNFYLFAREDCQAVAVEHRALELAKKLGSHLVGQSKAVQLIKHSFQNHDYTKPLSLHIVGENGVGKSYSAKLIRDTFFSSEECSLFIRGSEYEADNPEEYTARLRRLMVTYLSNNPYGLVIVDEFSSFHPSVVSVFTNFLDTTITDVQQYKNVKCHVKNSIFIFLSDFGAESYDEHTELSDAIDSIQTDHYSKFRSIKQLSLIKNIIPFDFINYDGAYQLVQHKLKQLDQNLPILKSINFTLQDNLAKHLTEYLYNISIKHYRYENYRGFLDKVFDRYFLFSLNQELHSTLDLTQNCDIHISWNFQHSKVNLITKRK